jgi:hypothetical protein
MQVQRRWDVEEGRGLVELARFVGFGGVNHCRKSCVK